MGNGKVSEKEYGNEEAHFRKNNFQIMNIKEKVAEIGETWGKSQTKVKVFMQQKVGLETGKIIIERVRSIGKKEEGKKDHNCKMFKLE